MKSVFFFLILILGIEHSNAQTDSKENLIGKWLLIEETDSFPDDIEPFNETDLNSGSKADLKTFLTFNKDGSFLVNQMGNEYKATLNLKGSTLTLGNRVFIIVKLDKEQLIFKVKDDLFDTQYHYKKLE